jgi:hypothetical protein
MWSAAAAAAAAGMLECGTRTLTMLARWRQSTHIDQGCCAELLAGWLQAISLKDCDVYSYQADCDMDPFGEPPKVHSFTNGLARRVDHCGVRPGAASASEYRSHAQIHVPLGTQRAVCTVPVSAGWPSTAPAVCCACRLKWHGM